jgi:hypothetical protein
MQHIHFPTARPSTVHPLTWLAGTLVLGLTLAACGGAAATTGPATAHDADDEMFRAHSQRVRSVVSEWSEGTGVALRFRENGGEPRDMLFADPTAPTWNEELGLWAIAAVAADEDDTILGHLMLGLAKLEPGAGRGDAETADVAVAILLTTGEWSGQHPDTAWSINPGSFARVELRRASGVDDLEGELEAKLVANDGATTITVEQGYLYIRR